MDPAHESRAIAFVVFAVLAVLAVPATADDCADGFDQRLLKAERLRDEAAAAGAEWLETGDLLKQARAEAADGKLDAACDLVAEAVFQAETAIEQAKREANAWRDRVLKQANR